MSYDEKMTDLASAVRAKSGASGELTVEGMTAAVRSISGNGGGVDTSDATAAGSDIRQGKTAYINGKKVTGTIPDLEAKTYMPGTAKIRIYPGVYVNGTQEIQGDTDLIPENIRATAGIFGVGGTFTIDADVTAADIRQGKTAYAIGQKVKGTMPDSTVETSGNVVTVEKGYIKEKKTITVGSAKELAPFTPGTQDHVIADGTYLKGDFIIKGDENLIAANIRAGLTIFNVDGTFTSDANALAEDILSGKTAYVKGDKVTGTMPYATATVNGNVVTLSTGYQTGGTVTVGTLFTPVPIVPGTADITIPQGSFLSGDLVVQGSDALIPENIRAGVVIFDVAGTYTSDATAGSFDILAGKTAYVKGEKVTGTILSITEETTYTPGTEDITIQRGVYLSAPQVIKGDANLLPENIKQGVTIFGVDGTSQGGTDTSDATATSGDILAGKTAYVNDEKLTGTIPVIDESKTYTPGTADLTIPGGFYVSVPQTVKGDANLAAENIKTGVKVFDVTGNFTEDATATANKIAKDETAYVKGEKITGTASIMEGYAVWTYVGGFIYQMLPTSNSIPTPTWGVGRLQYNNGELYAPHDGIKAREPIPGITFFASGRYPNNTSGYCIAEGKVYRVWYGSESIDGKWVYNIFHRQIPDLDGVTELVIVNGDRCVCRAGTQLYGVKQEGLVYPIADVQAKMLLNYTDTTGYATALAYNNNIVRIRFSDDEPYVEIDPLDRGYNFLNVNYLGEYDVYLDYGGAAYMLATEGWSNGNGRPDAKGTLWCRDAVNRSSGWIKTDLTNLDQMNWLGKCITQREEHYWWDEQTGEDHWDFINRQTEVALHIDLDGRLWKIAAKCDDNGNPAGIEYRQVGEDSDWSCVPSTITPGGTPFAQKGGKLVVLIADREPDIGITWNEYYFSPQGKLVAIADDNRLYFSLEDKTIDLRIPGGLV